MSIKNVVHRALTPVLTLLIAALGMVATVSTSRMQQKAEAFACNSGSGCTGSPAGNCPTLNPGNTNCWVCSSHVCTHS
jgi:hypothetical protein